MAMYIKEIGFKIRLMDKENIYIAMEPSMKAIGKMIFSMVLEYKHG